MKLTVCIVLFLILSILTIEIVASEPRTWLSNDKKFSIEAEFVETLPDGTKVSLRKNDGTVIQVVLKRLSQEDQEYVAKQNLIRRLPPIWPTGSQDQEYVARQNQIPQEKNPVADTSFKTTDENFLRYEDDGTVVIRSKQGGEEKKDIRKLTQDDMNCIIRQELKKTVVDPQLFQPDVIRQQIEVYCESNPMSLYSQYTGWGSNKLEIRYRRHVKRDEKLTKQEELTEDEKNCIMFVLVKFQEHIGEKMPEGHFVRLMEYFNDLKYSEEIGWQLDANDVRLGINRLCEERAYVMASSSSLDYHRDMASSEKILGEKRLLIPQDNEKAWEKYDYLSDLVSWTSTGFRFYCNHFAAHKDDEEVQEIKKNFQEKERKEQEEKERKERSEQGKEALKDLFN